MLSVVKRCVYVYFVLLIYILWFMVLMRFLNTLALQYWFATKRAYDLNRLQTVLFCCHLKVVSISSLQRPIQNALRKVCVRYQATAIGMRNETLFQSLRDCQHGLGQGLLAILLSQEIGRLPVKMSHSVY